jgi:hypothetical protein
MTIQSPSLVAAMMFTAAASAAGTDYDCTVSSDSTFSQTTDLVLPLAGIWIGNWNAATNPSGTKTIPGLFGGSGNNPIPFSGSFKPRISITDAHPAGTFGFTLDPDAGTAAVDGLALDVLNGQTGTIANTIVLSFSTFRTQQPSSTFFGISNLSVPISNDSISSATLAQNAPALGTAVADGLGGWTVTVAVPVDISVSGTALGAPFAQTSPGVVAFTGTATIGAKGVGLSLQASLNETSPVAAPPPLVEVPLPLPTIFPSGSTANLLMSATFSEGTSTSTLSTSIAATGTRVAPDPDLNGDGVVGGLDLAILLAAWATSDALADIDGNGTVEGPDLAVLLAAWE